MGNCESCCFQEIEPIIETPVIKEEKSVIKEEKPIMVEEKKVKYADIFVDYYYDGKIESQENLSKAYSHLRGIHLFNCDCRIRYMICNKFVHGYRYISFVLRKYEIKKRRNLEKFMEDFRNYGRFGLVSNSDYRSTHKCNCSGCWGHYIF